MSVGAPAGVRRDALETRRCASPTRGSRAPTATSPRSAATPAAPGGALLAGHETFRGAAEAVRDGDADLALLPIENTTAGSINETYDLLAEGGLTITGEVVSRDRALPAGAARRDARGARARCSRIRRRSRSARRSSARHPDRARRAEFDTAGAARKVRERGDPTLAAIASAAAARPTASRCWRAASRPRPGTSPASSRWRARRVPCPPGRRVQDLAAARARRSARRARRDARRARAAAAST